MDRYTISELTDLQQVRAYLTTGADYAAYALGDLEPPYSEHSIWFAAMQSGAVEGLALIYTGLEPAVLFLMGKEAAIRALLEHGIGPDSVYFNIQPEIESTLRSFYAVDHVAHMYRMKVTPALFRPLPDYHTAPLPRPLDETHLQDITGLICLAAEHDSRDLRDIAFNPAMIRDGYYYGIYREGTLIAMAGTHLIARQAGMAAVGNVVVHPDQRGQRLGSRVSHAVTQALIDAGCSLIVLNVRQDNTPAIRTYERLGYRKVCEFIEGAAARR